jgi:hypothetical protein
MFATVMSQLIFLLEPKEKGEKNEHGPLLLYNPLWVPTCWAQIGEMSQHTTEQAFYFLLRP